MQLGPRWAETNEWRVLMALYAEASAAPGMHWQLSDERVRPEGSRVGKVVPTRGGGGRRGGGDRRKTAPKQVAQLVETEM